MNFKGVTKRGRIFNFTYGLTESLAETTAFDIGKKFLGKEEELDFVVAVDKIMTLEEKLDIVRGAMPRLCAVCLECFTQTNMVNVGSMFMVIGSEEDPYRAMQSTREEEYLEMLEKIKDSPKIVTMDEAWELAKNNDCSQGSDEWFGPFPEDRTIVFRLPGCNTDRLNGFPAGPEEYDWVILRQVDLLRFGQRVEYSGHCGDGIYRVQFTDMIERTFDLWIVGP